MDKSYILYTMRHIKRLESELANLIEKENRLSKDLSRERTEISQRIAVLKSCLLTDIELYFKKGA